VQRFERNKNCSFFKVIKHIRDNARNELNEAVTVGGSNNVGVWGQIPQPAEANGG